MTGGPRARKESMLSSQLAAVSARPLLFYRLYSKDVFLKGDQKEGIEGASQGAPHSMKGDKEESMHSF